MNKENVVSQLRKEYPEGNIIFNNLDNPTEIICELQQTSRDSSTAIAVIERSLPHLHKKTTEEYEILKGELKLTVDGKDYLLKKEEMFVIEPNKVHMAQGNETWVKVISTPPWSPEDQILVS